MANKRIYDEQLVAAGLLLEIQEINAVDISLLFQDFIKKNRDFILKESKLTKIEKYVKSDNGRIYLKDGLSLDLYIQEIGTSLRKELEKIAGECVIKHFENFEMEDFVLKKIEHYFSIEIDILDKFFCKNQLIAINKLNEKGYLTTDYPVGAEELEDYKMLKLSEYGYMKVFKINNAEELERFCEKLEYIDCYDTSVLNNYLMEQDLKLPINEIFDIVKFKQYYDNKIKIKTYQKTINAQY